MSNADALKLKEYRVNELRFLRHEDFDRSDKRTIQLDPEISRSITRMNENEALVILSLVLEEKGNAIPFSITVTISGVFVFKNWENDPEKKAVMESNTVAILFPYLRNLVTMLTANGSVAPFILPVINVCAWLEDQEKKKQG